MTPTWFSSFGFCSCIWCNQLRKHLRAHYIGKKWCRFPVLFCQSNIQHAVQPSLQDQNKLTEENHTKIQSIMMKKNRVKLATLATWRTGSPRFLYFCTQCRTSWASDKCELFVNPAICEMIWKCSGDSLNQLLEKNQKTKKHEKSTWKVAPLWIMSWAVGVSRYLCSGISISSMSYGLSSSMITTPLSFRASL